MLGVVSLSFEVVADIILLETNNLKLVTQISALRPRAYICVFSDAPHVKNLSAIMFGVYTFPRRMIDNQEEFIGKVGHRFVPSNRTDLTLLKIETDNEGRVSNHRVSYYKNYKRQ